MVMVGGGYCPGPGCRCIAGGNMVMVGGGGVLSRSRVPLYCWGKYGDGAGGGIVQVPGAAVLLGKIW